MKLIDAPFHTLLVVKQRVDEQMRHMYYVRRETEDKGPENFIPTFGIATVQACLLDLVLGKFRYQQNRFFYPAFTHKLTEVEIAGA